MYDPQEDTGRDNNNQVGLGGNLVQEGNIMAEGEEMADQYPTNQNPIQDENSFHMGNYIEKIHENPNFVKKEQEISQKLDNIFREKTGKSISNFTGYIFMVNKILMLSTFTEFLFQRFDIITLFLNLVIILIEVGIFSHKHMYKWLIVLLGSLLLDALVLLDISPVSYNFLNFFKFLK